MSDFFIVEDADLVDAVNAASFDGTCPTIGDVDAYGVHFTLVEDMYDMDFIVEEDDRGAVSVFCFPDHITIGPDGYEEPARNMWTRLENTWVEWANMG